MKLEALKAKLVELLSAPGIRIRLGGKEVTESNATSVLNKIDKAAKVTIVQSYVLFDSKGKMVDGITVNGKWEVSE